MKTIIIITIILVGYFFITWYTSDNKSKKELKEAIQELKDAWNGLNTLSPYITNGILIVLLIICIVLAHLFSNIFP